MTELFKYKYVVTVKRRNSITGEFDVIKIYKRHTKFGAYMDKLFWNIFANKPYIVPVYFAERTLAL